MDYKEINELLQRSLNDVFFFDSELVERQVHEECINHRLAHYLELIFPMVIKDEMFYSVDMEYDKNLDKKNKEIKLDDGRIFNIRPDIIIHKRNSNRDNLIAIEAKKNRLDKGDMTKLEKLLFEPYEYDYTAGVMYKPGSTEYKYQIFRLEEEAIICEEFILEKPERNSIALN